MSLKILVVDDEPVSRSLLAEGLGRYGHVTQGVSGAEAEAMIAEALRRRRHFDLVCLDIGLPDVDGVEVVRRIRDQEANVQLPSDAQCKILMVTGDKTVPTIVASFKAMADGYLVKPVRLLDLREKLAGVGFASAG